MFITGGPYGPTRGHRIVAGKDSRGVALSWVAVGLVAILGIVGMSFDLGCLELAAQRCQEVADSAALGAAQELPSGGVTSTALGLVTDNTQQGSGWPVTSATSDVVTYGPGSTIGTVALDSTSSAVEVTVHGPVQFLFLGVIGLEQATAYRSATAMRGASASGYPFVPIWIDRATAESAEYAPGMTDILMADGPTYPGVPGSFGFLDPPESIGFRDALNGSDLTEEQMNDCIFDMDDDLYAYTGLNVGQWTQELEDRIDRGSTGIYEGDTADSFTDGNPRVVICPIVEYIEGGGANAYFEIQGYVAFWLEDVVNITGDKAIQATFIDYYIPGDDLYDVPTFEGFYSVKLIV